MKLQVVQKGIWDEDREEWPLWRPGAKPAIALQGPYLSRHLSSLSLNCNLRQGYWGIIIINNVITLIFYPNCRGVRETRLYK